MTAPLGTGRDGGAAMQFVQGETGDVANCSVHMEDTLATANVASGRGGGLFLAIYGFGGVTTSNIGLVRSIARNNHAVGEGGGVIALVSGSALSNTGSAVEIVGAQVGVAVRHCRCCVCAAHAIRV